MLLILLFRVLLSVVILLVMVYFCMSKVSYVGEGVVVGVECSIDGWCECGGV